MGARRVRVLALTAVVAAITLVAGPAAATTDEFWPQQWGPQQINVEPAWAAGAVGGGVKVAVIDSGVDISHPDLAGRIAATTDCTSGTCVAGGQDDNNHGTHVSGIIAANANNGRGIAGVAHGAQLLVAKVLDINGGGDIAHVVAGIEWAVASGAHVINLSFGPDNDPATRFLLGSPQEMLQAIDRAWDAGVVPVLAAGNESTGIGLPGLDGSNNYGTVKAIVVGATGQSGQPTSYSSGLGNAQWAVVAPGGAGTRDDSIISTVRDGYGRMSGTSMAVPHVAGVAAMLVGQGLGRDAVRDRILSTADASVSCGGRCRGRLNAAAAIGSAAPSTVNTQPTTNTTQPAGSNPSTANPSNPNPNPSNPNPNPSNPNPSPNPTPGLSPLPNPATPPNQAPLQPPPEPAPPPPPPPPAPVFAPQEPPAPVFAPPLAPPPSPSLDPPAAAPPSANLPVATALAPPTTAPPPTFPAPPIPTTTTVTAPPTTTTTTTALVAQPPRAAPGTSRAVYGENGGGGGSMAEAIAVATLLLGTAATALAITRKPAPPDLL